MKNLVAKVVGEFAADHDPERERARIADVGGRPAGSIFGVAEDWELDLVEEGSQLR